MEKKRLLIVIPILLAAALAAGYFRNRPVSDPNAIRLSGNIEITDAELSFKIAGKVQERLVSEGDVVKAGQPVARLDSTDLQQEVLLRKSEVQAAEAALAELLAGSRSEEIAQARAAVDRSKAELERARLEDERIGKLFEQQVVSSRELDAARAARQVAEARVKESSEALRLSERGPRSERIDQARANLKAAGDALALAETRAGYAQIAAPFPGVVLSENTEAGEYVSPGTPVVTVGDLQNVWLRAFINETDLGRLKVGQPATITVDSYPGKTYNGKVTFIASVAEFTPKNVQTKKERVRLVYRIKIDIPNPDMELKPGMPADGIIQVAGN